MIGPRALLHLLLVGLFGYIRRAPSLRGNAVMIDRFLVPRSSFSCWYYLLYAWRVFFCFALLCFAFLRIAISLLLSSARSIDRDTVFAVARPSTPLPTHLRLSPLLDCF
ncbi:hypothetical protein HDK77DRAFT_274861 [Phyllosticta capitalensis]